MAGPSSASKFLDPQAASLAGRTQQFGVSTVPSSGFASQPTSGGWAVGEQAGPHGQRLGWYLIDEVLTISGATNTTTSTIPIGTVCVYTATRVNTTISGNSVANYSLGISGATTRFQGTTTNITSGDTNCGSAIGSGTTPYTSATAIVLTCDQAATAGAVRVTAWCQYICPPSS